MRRRLRVFVLAGIVLGCSGEDTDRGPLMTDTLTRRARDSIIAQSKLPGARSIGKALDVSDSAAARAAAIDSLLSTTRVP